MKENKTLLIFTPKEQDNIEDLVSNFEYYKNIGEHNFRTNDYSDIFYRLILEYHKKSKNINNIFENKFLKHIYATLIQWNIGQRGSKIISLDCFIESVNECKELILKLLKEELITYDINRLDDSIIEVLFKEIKVTRNERTNLVGKSKALHFLLPHLFIPVDNKYILKFFNKKPDDWETYKRIFNGYLEILNSLKKLPKSSLDHPIPKIIDNAIIGKSMYENNLKIFKDVEYHINYKENGEIYIPDFSGEI